MLNFAVCVDIAITDMQADALLEALGDSDDRNVLDIIGEEDFFGDMDGKGVFLYATRGARSHLNKLLSPGSRVINLLRFL